MLAEIELTPNVVVGILATIVILMGVRGLMPHLFKPSRREAFHLASAVILLLAGGAGRTVYWDITRVMIGPDQWSVVRDVFGGVQANVFWNGILLWGGLHLLKLLHMLVPLIDRRKYSMWTAWNYPVHLGRAVTALRWKARRRNSR